VNSCLHLPINHLLTLQLPQGNYQHHLRDDNGIGLLHTVEIGVGADVENFLDASNSSIVRGCDRQTTILGLNCFINEFASLINRVVESSMKLGSRLT
jgi:hypothetical protein